MRIERSYEPDTDAQANALRLLLTAVSPTDTADDTSELTPAVHDEQSPEGDEMCRASWSHHQRRMTNEGRT